jgi:hypothetical protein
MKNNVLARKDQNFHRDEEPTGRIKSSTDTKYGNTCLVGALTGEGREIGHGD